MTRSFLFNAAKGLLYRAASWKMNRDIYPDCPEWQEKCDCEIAELRKTARTYLRWMKNADV